MRQRLQAWLRRRHDEGGYAAIMVAIMIPTVFLGCCAIGVDTARWYVAQQDVQQAADAAALAGVPYLPQDLPSAITRAKQVATRNGYTDGVNGTTVSVTLGDTASQLSVTITAKVHNQFGSMIGINNGYVSENAVADYTGPAPMGSPCNTFGNEPNAGAGSSSPSPTGTAQGSSPFTNCSRNPKLWAEIEGPQTQKVQGDRYQTLNCGVTKSQSVDGCSSDTNSEYRPQGYYYVVHVEKAAVGQPISLQLYDPAFVNTGQQCESLPNSSNLSNNMNDYVTTDGQVRYSNSTSGSGTTASFCTGDSFVSGDGTTALTTSFVLRHQTDTNNPANATVENDTSGGACIRQYAGYNSAPTATSLQESTTTTTTSHGKTTTTTTANKSYNAQLAQVFHNWTTMCTFTPDVDGDYYLQVRTNVAFGGTKETNSNSLTSMISDGNTAAAAASANSTSGYGGNAFAIRAVTVSGLEKDVSVSGWDKMAIYENGTSSTATFNLIRVLPGAAGQYVNFSFFDVADSETGNASVQVTLPSDATSTAGGALKTPFPGNCTAVGGYAGSSPTALSNCKATVTSTTNNGKVETMSIPIPTDYTCNYTSLGGCWYQVSVNFPSGSVHDVTTWDATVQGDPVRLIQ